MTAKEIAEARRDALARTDECYLGTDLAEKAKIFRFYEMALLQGGDAVVAEFCKAPMLKVVNGSR